VNAEDLYEWLMGADHQPTAVAALHDTALCAVSGWLGRTYDENAESGQLLGLCLVESARRFSAVVARGKYL
jgi:hypothetical protein